MTQLHCNMSSCSSHKEGCCCLPSIHVEGPAAKKSAETVCGSYQKRGAAQNVAHHNAINPQMEIACTVCECCYNANSQCTSDKVSIDCNCGCGERSACATFKV